LAVVSKFPDLSWRWHDDVPILKGIYQFKTEYRGIPFQDSFNLKFNFPQNYPENIPLVNELDKKIPDKFHHFTNGNLCLCTPLEQWLVFSKEPTLENYIKNLLNPYLLSWLWYDKFNEMPWGERSHGVMGLVQSYQEKLNINDLEHTILFMVKFIKNEMYQRQDCPCGSGLPFRKCHKKIINRLENQLPQDQLRIDFYSILGG
jgi:hypothetical protein